VQIGSVPVGTVLSGFGVLGGLLWIARWAVGGDALLWAGAALLTVLAAGAGAGLVRPVPLRVVVGVCVALLCWSLGAVLGLDGDPVRAGIAGLVLVVLVPVWWERTRPLPATRAHGSHAVGGRAVGGRAVGSRAGGGRAGGGQGARGGSASTPAEAPPVAAAPAGARRRADRRSRSAR
jgi:hypothetical protein